MNNRMVWMDTLRGAAILLVIYAHTLAALEVYGNGYPKLLGEVSEMLTPFRIPTLMFLSGLLVGRSLRKGTGTFVSGKLRLIAWPFVLWTVVILALQNELTWADFGYSMWRASTVLWYLWFLVAFYLAMIVVHKLPALPVVVVSLVVSALAPEFMRLDRMAFLFAFFVLGHWAEQHKHLWLPVVRNRTFLATSAIVVIALAYLSSHNTPVRFQPAYALWSIVAIGGLIGAATYLPTTTVASRVLAFVGRHSIVYYVTHWPVLIVTVSALVDVGVTRSIHQIPIAGVAILLVGTGLALVSERSKTVDALFRLPRFRTPARTAAPTTKATPNQAAA
jgi:uncharacterized membrane protein YcfT